MTILWASAGCATSGDIELQRWLAQVGGIDRDVRCDHLNDFARRLVPSSGPHPIHMIVISDDRPLAYAWPPATVVVTRGLVENYAEGFVAAAVAHEIGHLIADGHVASGQALTATGHQTLDEEARADDIGCTLLMRAGIQRSAMYRLLERLSGDQRLASDVRQDLKRRADRLKR